MLSEKKAYYGKEHAEHDSEFFYDFREEVMQLDFSEEVAFEIFKFLKNKYPKFKKCVEADHKGQMFIGPKDDFYLED